MSLGGPKNSRTTLSEINVTPLVDVMLVLLIIFMVTTPMMQQGIEVDLPETKGAASPIPEEPFVLVVNKDKKIFIGTVSIGIEDLSKKLKAIFSTRKSKEIFLQADRTVEYGVVAEVMGEIRGAGIFQIGLVTLPKSGP